MYLLLELNNLKTYLLIFTSQITRLLQFKILDPN